MKFVKNNCTATTFIQNFGSVSKDQKDPRASFVSWPFCFTLTELNPFIYPRGGLCREGNMVKIFNRPIDRPFAG